MCAAERDGAPEHAFEGLGGTLIFPGHHFSHPVEDDVPKDLGKEVLLVTKELVEKAVRYPGSSGDLRHGRSRVTELAETFLGCFEDTLTPAFALLLSPSTRGVLG